MTTSTIILLIWFFGLALWESFQPRRPYFTPVGVRWGVNLSLGLLNLILAGILLPDFALTHPEWVPTVPHEVWQRIDHAPLLAFLLGFLLVDIFYYWLHRLLHAVPLLWRLHLVHHADPEIDVSTALRHHPFENLVTSLIGLMPALALGVEPAVVAFYVLASASIGYFHHANIELPRRIGALTAMILVMPDVHRIHHSIIVGEGNSNFGAVLSLWDRIFGTYVRKRPFEHGRIEFGVERYQDRRYCALRQVLAMPFSPRRTQAVI